MNLRTVGTVERERERERELHFYRKSTKHEKCFICDICDRWMNSVSRFLTSKNK